MEAREHRLDVACRIAGALFESASVEAMNLIDELELPTAIFVGGQRTARLTNEAWRALFGTRDVVRASSWLGDAIEPGATMHAAELALALTGRPCYVAATVRQGRDSLGAPVNLIACVEITDETLARQLAVDASVLVWSGLGAGDGDYLNCRWSGHADSPASWRQAIHRDDLAKCTKAQSWAVREHGSTDIEIRIRAAEGEYRWHRVRFAVAGSGSRWFATAIDIHDAHEALTERNELLVRVRAATADAETASRLKDQFLAVVSHELRAPLTTIVLWEGVLRSETDPVLRAKALEVIRQSALGQSRVVGDLLDISRGIAGKLHVDLRTVEIGKLVRDALEAIGPTAVAKQILVEHRDTVLGAEVKGDAGRLRQVLDNLLSNAIKFTDPGGTIGVAVVRRGRSIVIDIHDSGCGIPSELLPRLFDPFSQSEDALTRMAGGLGLGLAIAKQLVEVHGGTVIASSDGPGRGATLTVTLPALPVRRRATPPDGIRHAARLERTRVLVVDDDQRVLEALAVLLDRAGAVVETASSAHAARDRIAHGVPDVVVCDIAMPGEDGYSFMRELRAARSNIAAIALTAYATEHDVEDALAAGFDRHLAKPIDFERLVASIDELAVARRNA